MHTQMCQDIFQRQAMEAKMREIQKREMLKKIAEDNLMVSFKKLAFSCLFQIAENKRKQEMEKSVRDKLQMQNAIASNKVKPPTMIR